MSTVSNVGNAKKLSPTRTISDDMKNAKTAENEQQIAQIKSDRLVILYVDENNFPVLLTVFMNFCDKNFTYDQRSYGIL